MSLKLTFDKCYKALTTKSLYSKIVAYTTIIVGISLLSDIIAISSGLDGYALSAVFKTIGFCFGFVLLIEYKVRDPILDKMSLGDWGKSSN
jgi:hypothetical protein